MEDSVLPRKPTSNQFSPGDRKCSRNSFGEDNGPRSFFATALALPCPFKRPNQNTINHRLEGHGLSFLEGGSPLALAGLSDTPRWHTVLAEPTAAPDRWASVAHYAYSASALSVLRLWVEWLAVRVLLHVLHKTSCPLGTPEGHVTHISPYQSHTKTAREPDLGFSPSSYASAAGLWVLQVPRRFFSRQ